MKRLKFRALSTALLAVLATFVPVATATAGASGTPIATADIALGAASAPLGVAADGDYVWITDLAENQVIQISERTGTVVARIDVGFSPTSISIINHLIWVTCAGDQTGLGRGSGELDVIYPGDQALEIAPTVGSRVSFGGLSPIAASGYGAKIWVAFGGGVSEVAIVDATTFNTSYITLQSPSTALFDDGTNTFVGEGTTVHVFNADTGAAVASFDTCNSSNIVSDGVSIFVACDNDNGIDQVDYTNLFSNGFIAVDTPTGMALDGNSLWVSNLGSGTVDQLDQNFNYDSATTPYIASYSVGAYPAGVAFDGYSFAGSHVWVANVASGSVSYIPVPSQIAGPQDVAVVKGDGTVDVSWKPPVLNFDLAVDHYEISVSPSGGTFSVDAGTRTAKITGLTNGTNYQFSVRAFLGASISTNASVSPSITPMSPATAPGAPTGVQATAGNASATLHWTAPASDGGSPITGYTVTASPGGATCSTSTTSCVVSSLLNGTSYSFTVTATNAIGSGAASSPSSAVTPATAPSAPTGVQATLSQGFVSIRWSPPSSDGGGAITGYTVTASPGGATCTSATTSCTMKALGAGVDTTYAVTASNRVGTSISSLASNPVHESSHVYVRGFARKSSSLTSAMKLQILNTARAIAGSHRTYVVIGGFTGSKVGSKIDQALALARARAVAGELQRDLGAASSSVTIKSQGSSKAVGAPNSPLEGCIIDF